VKSDAGEDECQQENGRRCECRRTSCHLLRGVDRVAGTVHNREFEEAAARVRTVSQSCIGERTFNSYDRGPLSFEAKALVIQGCEASGLASRSYQQNDQRSPGEPREISVATYRIERPAPRSASARSACEVIQAGATPNTENMMSEQNRKNESRRQRCEIK
jgi:hypothetical protein